MTNSAVDLAALESLIRAHLGDAPTPYVEQLVRFAQSRRELPLERLEIEFQLAVATGLMDEHREALQRLAQ